MSGIRSIILLLAIVGLVMLGVGYVKSNLQCPPNIVEYRYVEKTFNQEQNTPTPIMSISGMNSMFEDDSPWIAGNSFATQDVKVMK
jgi:hypothetical protein